MRNEVYLLHSHGDLALDTSSPHLLSPPRRYICVLTAPRCDCAVSSSADFSLDPSGNQREVRSASASSALLAGPQASPSGSAPPGPGAISAAPKPQQVPLSQWGLIPTSHHSVSSHLGCCPSFHTLTSWSPLGRSCLAGPELLVSGHHGQPRIPSLPPAQSQSPG